MLKVENLEVIYAGNPPVNAVKGISFELAPGKTTVLVGPSGSGKSATASAILNQLPSDSKCSGQISLQSPGQSARSLFPNSDLSKREKGSAIGWVPQDAQRTLSPTRTIGSLIEECASFHQTDHPSINIPKLLEELGLSPDIAKAYPHQLSGGQKQRCMLAMALIKHPNVLIADEPTTAMDVINEEQLLQLLKRIQTERQLTILFITHDQRIASLIGDQFLYMREGRLTEPTDSIQSPSPVNDSAPSTPTSLLTVTDVSVKYGSRGGIFSSGSEVMALKNVSFSLGMGETLGIAGESGSGKSTLAKCLTGLLPHEGIIRFQDESDGNVQLVLQDSYSSLHPRFSISGNLEESLRVWRKQLTREERREAIVQLLQQVQLDESYADKLPGELSGGERQRVSIARALIPSPKLLILDESISSLDQELQAEMIHLIRSLTSKQGISLIVISHDLRILSQLCQMLIILHQGEVVESGSTQAILKQATHPQTKRLLEASGFQITGS